MKKRALYTTSEYLDALTLPDRLGGNVYECKGMSFGIFPSAEAAERDAQFLVDFYKREGVRKRKPTVYRIRLEKEKEKK
jgi:hypothetical protein